MQTHLTAIAVQYAFNSCSTVAAVQDSSVRSSASGWSYLLLVESQALAFFFKPMTTTICCASSSTRVTL
jgi:hypothetical protein